MTRGDGARWYAVHTRPHAESKAARHLERQGFATYLPRYLKRRRHARKIDVAAAPLFPRYLFVAVDMATQRWRAISSTVGVVRLVCNGDVPAPVPEGVIEQLRAHQDERGFVRLAAGARLRPGERVRVLDGAFCDCLGLFEGVTDGERVAILLELLGRKVRVLLDASLLAAA